MNILEKQYGVTIKGMMMIVLHPDQEEALIFEHGLGSACCKGSIVMINEILTKYSLFCDSLAQGVRKGTSALRHR